MIPFRCSSFDTNKNNATCRDTEVYHFYKVDPLTWQYFLQKNNW